MLTAVLSGSFNADIRNIDIMQFWIYNWMMEAYLDLS